MAVVVSVPPSSNTINGGGRTNGINHHLHSVVIETSSPIRPLGNQYGFCALAIGLCLALHTPLWLVLVFYKEAVWNGDDEQSEATTVAVSLLRFLSRWLLEFTPWFANTVLSIFVGVLFLTIGFATLQVSDSNKQ